MESHDKMTKWALKGAGEFININGKMRRKIRLKFALNQMKVVTSRKQHLKKDQTKKLS